VVLLTAPLAPSQQPAAFNPTPCSATATDIVVADAEGRVLESWRGTLKPGDTVRLGAGRLTPERAMPWGYQWMRPQRVIGALYRGWNPRSSIFENAARTIIEDKWEELLRGERPYSELWEVTYKWPWSDVGNLGPESKEPAIRYVLFLRRADFVPGGEPVWLPAQGPGWVDGFRAEIGYRFLNRAGPPSYFAEAREDFSTSVALVEGERVYALRRSPGPSFWPAALTGCWESGVVPLSGNLNEFKEVALALPPARLFTNRNTASRSGDSLRAWEDFGTFASSLPPELSAKGTHP
jgi:hypothetical protein